MRFDGSLGNVQIAGDFRIVTSLKKKIYDLPFPGTHLVELFFHKTAPDRCDPGRCKWLSNQVSRRIWIRVFASHFAFTRPNRGRDVN